MVGSTDESTLTMARIVMPAMGIARNGGPGLTRRGASTSPPIQNASIARRKTSLANKSRSV
jgi:hypothetical protein